jgi:perosamine synthetase
MYLSLAVVRNGANLIPVDSDIVTGNLNLDLLEELITPKTRAIIPVHLYGHPVDMDRLNEIACKYDLIVIEDCAEAHGAACRGKKVGSSGSMGCFSFYANKIITTGEGGMVVTNDVGLARRLRELCDLDRSSSSFTYDEPTFSFRLSAFQAAMGLSQLKRIEDVIARKRRTAETYGHCLSDIPGLRLPIEADWARNVFWMYAVVVQPDFGMTRDQLAKSLRLQGIETRTFFCSLSRQSFLHNYAGFRDRPCPVAETLGEAGLYLPSSHDLTESEIHRIGHAVKSAAGRPRNIHR